MTRQDFLEKVNYGRYLKYTLSQIKESVPDKECDAIICTKSGRIMLAKYKYGKWQQAHFTPTEDNYNQEIWFDAIDDDVMYWTDGRANDSSREQFEC